MNLQMAGRLALLSGAAVTFLGASEALAFDPYPNISGEVVMELQNEYAFDSDDPDADEQNNMFWRTEVAPTVAFTENFFIDGVLVLEPVRDFDPGEDNYFEDEGVFVEEIKLNYESGPWAIFAGKFNPGFGIAWDFGRGIWSEDFAEDYEITEKIGGGASYTFETENSGDHTLTASTFFADTTFLSEATVHSRGNTTKSDGGASNTEDFSSFVISLEGENVAGVENLYYKTGFRHLAEADASTGGDDEQGFVATLGHVFPVSDNIEADALVEFVDIANFDGGNDDNQYITGSLITTINDAWNVTVGFTRRDIDVDGGPDMDDHLLQVSGGYDFGQGTTAEIGWRSSEEGGSDTDIVGGLIRHSFEF